MGNLEWRFSNRTSRLDFRILHSKFPIQSPIFTPMLKPQIPNLLTLFNLFMGCISIYFVYTQQYMTVFFLILLAAVADVFDGQVARWLQVDGKLGKELDSLADVVSFGVVPGTILFQLIRYAHESTHQYQAASGGTVIGFLGFIFTIGAAYRLARFNIDTRQTKDFIGLATPSATVAVLGLMLIQHNGEGWWYEHILNEYVLIFLSIGLFVLMNSNIRMFSLKSFKNGVKGNELPLIFIAGSILAIAIWRGTALFIIPFAYALVSFLFYKPKES